MSEDEAFWRFSLAFYERPGVADALIALQDRDGFDVNLVLFALWLGISGRGALDGDALAAAERVAGTLRSEIVEPLRRLRRKLRHHPDGDVQRLREGVKVLEIAGEKLVQERLARLAGRGAARRQILEAGEPPPMPISRSISAGKGSAARKQRLSKKPSTHSRKNL